MPSPADWIARALAVVTLLVAVSPPTLASTAAGSSAGEDQTLPPQGLYEGCSPGSDGDACIEHLVAIRAAGFRYVLNYSSWYGSPADVLNYADAAAALGLQLIWPLNHPAWRGLVSLGATYSTLGGPGVLSAPSDPSDVAFLDGAIGLVASHPATWGFYIGEELPQTEANRVATLSARVRRLAPDSPQLYIARPGPGRLKPFAHLVDVAGVDAYPVGALDPPVHQAARSARAAASASGAQTTMVLQAFAWSHYMPALSTRYPSLQRLRAMREAAIRQADPVMILWYSYQDILRADAPEQRWHDLTRAAFAPITPIGN